MSPSPGCVRNIVKMVTTTATAAGTTTATAVRMKAVLVCLVLMTGHAGKAQIREEDQAGTMTRTMNDLDKLNSEGKLDRFYFDLLKSLKTVRFGIPFKTDLKIEGFIKE